MIKLHIIIIFVLLLNQNFACQTPSKADSNNYEFDKKAILDTISKKMLNLRRKCYPENDISNEPFAVYDLVDTTNTIFQARGVNNVRFINNHVYHFYGINEECASILMLLHNNKIKIFDTFEDDEFSNGINNENWVLDPINTNVPKQELKFQHYIFAHKKKIIGVLNLIYKSGYKYSQEELERIKMFNSNRFRLRTWK